MLDLQLLSVQLHNFGPFEDCTLDVFRFPGLTQIYGENSDMESADSNGAGKSALLDAIAYGFWGISVRNDKINNVIREGEDEGHVTIRAVSNNVPVVICRGRKNGSPFLTVDTEDATFEGKAAEDYLKDTFFNGVTYELASWLLLIAGHNLSLFTTAKDSERTNVLLRLVTDLSFEAFQKNAKENARKAAFLVTSLQGEVREIDSEIIRLKNKAQDYNERLQEYSAKLEKLKRRESEVGEYTELSAELRGVLESIRNLEGEQDKLQAQRYEISSRHLDEEEISKLGLEEKKRQYEVDVVALTASAKEHTQRAEEAKREIDKVRNMRGTVCPTCGQDITAEHTDAVVKEYEAILKSEEVLVLDSRKQLEVASKNLRGINEKIKDIREKAKSVTEEKLSKIDAQIADVRSKVKELNASSKRLTAVLDQASSLASDISATENRLSVTKEESKQCIREIKNRNKRTKELVVKIDEANGDVNFWTKVGDGFGTRSGVPKILVQWLVKSINKRLDHYAALITGSAIDVKLVIRDDLKRQPLELVVDNRFGGPAYSSASRGEKRRIDLAVMLSLIDHFRSIGVLRSNFLAVDEVTDGMDRVGVAAVINALRALNIPHQMLVTHSEVDEFDGEIVVKKRGGVSSAYVNGDKI